jgi:hypothetical protein
MFSWLKSVLEGKSKINFLEVYQGRAGNESKIKGRDLFLTGIYSSSENVGTRIPRNYLKDANLA